MESDGGVDLKATYLVALTWASAVVTGSETEIFPATNVERMFVVAVMLVSFIGCSLLVAYIITTITKQAEGSRESRKTACG